MGPSLSEEGSCSPYGFQERGYGSHQAITQLVGLGTKVLDVGCASGYLMNHLQNFKKCKCMGVEPNAEMAIAARDAGFKVLAVDAVSALAALSPSDRFDHIIFGDVLEHLINPADVLKAAAPLLLPDGSVIVSLPNIVSIHARASITFGVWRYQEAGIFDKTHLRFYTIKTGRELLLNSGFKITHETFVGPLTFWGGERLKPIVALRPNLLANQMVFSAKPVGH